jgi:hypothetical protein
MMCCEQRAMSRQHSAKTDQPRNSRFIGRIIRAGQIATAIAAIVGAVFLVTDRLPTESPPETLSASLSDLSVEWRVTFKRFLAAKGHLQQYSTRVRATGLPTQKLNNMLNTIGIQVTYQLAVQGPPGRRLELKPRIYQAHGLIPAKTPRLTQSEIYKSEAWRDEQPDRTWIPYPLHAGTYYIQLDMTERRNDGPDQLVATARTDKFRVKGD